MTGIINGTVGADVYLYDRGDGNRWISDPREEDQLIFGSGITASQVSFIKSGYNLVVTISDDDVATVDNTITITDWTTGANNRIEEFVFDDGTVKVFHIEDFIGTVNDDVYLYERSDGNVRVTDTGGEDQLIFGNGITESQVTLRMNGNNLMVTISGDDGTSNTIRTADSVTKASNRIEEFIFNDGTVKLVQTDSFRGTVGDDVYFYDHSNGNHWITDRGGEDQFIFSNNIEVSQVNFSKSNNDLMAWISNDDGTSNIIRFYHWMTAVNNRIEEFVFDDGTIITGEDATNEVITPDII